MKDDKIINQRVARIAKDHSCAVSEVNAALDRHAVETDRQTYCGACWRSRWSSSTKLAEAFRDKAIVDRDVASGALLTKIHERRATLLGLNAPASAAVHIPSVQPPGG